MPLFRLTQTLAKLVPASRATPAATAVPPEHEWFASLFFIEGKKCVLFTQRTTLFAFVRPAVTAAELRDFPALFRQEFARALHAMSLSESLADHFGVHEPAHYAPTNDPRILGSMNEYKRLFENPFERQGGLARADIGCLNADLNEAPMSVVGMASPIDLVRALSAG